MVPKGIERVQAGGHGTVHFFTDQLQSQPAGPCMVATPQQPQNSGLQNCGVIQLGSI